MSNQIHIHLSNSLYGVRRVQVCKPVHPEIIMDEITDAICSYYNVRPQELKEHTRARRIVKPRQIIMYIMHKRLPKISLKDIGNYFGGFDHTTIIHSKAIVQDLMQTDAEYRDEILELLKITLP